MVAFVPLLYTLISVHIMVTTELFLYCSLMTKELFIKNVPHKKRLQTVWRSTTWILQFFLFSFFVSFFFVCLQRVRFVIQHARKGYFDRVHWRFPKLTHVIVTHKPCTGPRTNPSNLQICSFFAVFCFLQCEVQSFCDSFVKCLQTIFLYAVIFYTNSITWEKKTDKHCLDKFSFSGVRLSCWIKIFYEDNILWFSAVSHV